MAFVLGKLNEIENLRNVWKNEATDFTKWLATSEGIELLSDATGIDISVIRTEENVGDFNVDIFAEEETTKKKIIIENQLERTNHDHLGKLITYAAGKDANYIIWIVKQAREEHRQAVDWLNERTDITANFFLIEIKLLQINDSAIAPKFEVVCKPNDWTKTVRELSNESFTELKMQQLEYWNEFIAYCHQQNDISFNLRKANPQHWYDISIGSSRAWMSLWINTKKNIISCNLYIGGRDKDENKRLYYYLENNKEAIENSIGFPLDWCELSNKKTSIIGLSHSLVFADEANWQNSFEWFKHMTIKSKAVFYNYIQKFENE